MYCEFYENEKKKKLLDSYCDGIQKLSRCDLKIWLDHKLITSFTAIHNWDFDQHTRDLVVGRSRLQLAEVWDWEVKQIN